MQILWKWARLALGCAFVFASSSRAQEVQSEVEHSRQLLHNQMELKLRELETVSGGGGTEDLGEQILVILKPKR